MTTNTLHFLEVVLDPNQVIVSILDDDDDDDGILWFDQLIEIIMYTPWNLLDFAELVEVTIEFLEQSFKVVEGEGGVTLEVAVREGDIPVSRYVTISLATHDQSANGLIQFILELEYFAYLCPTVSPCSPKWLYWDTQ